MATYLTERCRLSDRVTYQVADALHLPFEDAAFEAVFLQHVAMNIEDRLALYTSVCRILAPGGRFATYDLVLGDGDVVYPVPWARDASTSFLLSEDQTRTAAGRWKNRSFGSEGTLFRGIAITSRSTPLAASEMATGVAPVS